MKKLLLVLAFMIISCSEDSDPVDTIKLYYIKVEFFKEVVESLTGTDKIYHVSKTNFIVLEKYNASHSVVLDIKSKYSTIPVVKVVDRPGQLTVTTTTKYKITVQ